MKRVLLAVVALIVPVAAAAQTPVPPVPPAAPVPAAMPLPAPLPRLAVVGTPIAPPTILDQLAMEDMMQALQAAQAAGADQQREQVRMAAEMARRQSDMARTQIDQARLASGLFRADRVWDTLDLQTQHFGLFAQESDGSYGSGLNLINQRQYEQAIARFDRTVTQKGSRADGALYWKAFAQYKLGRTDDALATLAQLRKDFASSRYLSDARALETEVRKPRDLNAIDDDDLLLLAITGIMNSDAARAIPLVEGVLGRATSPRVKQRALFVLAQSDLPQAHAILLSYAKGTGNPDLQREAISYLAGRRNKQTTTAELLDIYNTSTDQATKMTVLAALSASGDKPSLVTIAGNTNTPIAIRQSAVRGLTELVSPQELWTLYSKEADKDLRAQMVSAFSAMGATEQLVQIARTDRDPVVRQRAIRSLGSQKIEKTGTTLAGLYAPDQDRDTRNAIILALTSQNNADGLVEIAKKETDIQMRTAIVRRLVDLAPKSKAAADFLESIIKK
jgi:TolA-binding protein